MLALVRSSSGQDSGLSIREPEFNSLPDQKLPKSMVKEDEPFLARKLLYN